MSKQPTTAGTSTATRGQRGRRHHTAIGTAALVVVLATLAMAGTASAAPTGGNAPAAKACQKAGYQSLARAESPTVAFTSSDECTAYAAEGGTLTPLHTVNLAAFEEACEAVGGTYFGDVSEGSATLRAFFCFHIPVQGQEATLEAACDEMNGIFGYRVQDFGTGYFIEAKAECRQVTVPA